MFFGLQAILKQNLLAPVTDAHVDEARDFFAAHGEPFNEAGWRRIVREHGGRLPVRIRAVPEGSVVPTHQALVTIESTDPQAFWLPSYLETLLLRVWYPVTVATLSWHAKKTIREFLLRTSDDPDGELPFKLHDFGARGVSSHESAGLGGAAHLVNFLGTDNVAGVLTARAFYGAPMAGFSIPAAEHSTITSWGREHEVDAYRNMLRRFAKPGARVAVRLGQLRRLPRDRRALGQDAARGGDPIGRDRRHPARFGRAGRRGASLPRAARGALRQHDERQGLPRAPARARSSRATASTRPASAQILERITAAGFSADNVAFGMGGALLQQLNRDTQKFALKCSAARVDGEWRDVYKDPVTDKGKTSKRGRLTLLRSEGGDVYRTVAVPREAASVDDVPLPAGFRPALEVVYENGRLLRDWTFDEIRERSAQALR